MILYALIFLSGLMLGSVVTFLYHKDKITMRCVGIIGLTEDGMMKLNFKVRPSSFMDDSYISLKVSPDLKNALREENDGINGNC